MRIKSITTLIATVATLLTTATVSANSNAEQVLVLLSSETQMTQAPSSYVVKFSQGHHSSILTTGFQAEAGGTAAGHAAASMEMQKQVATFLKSKGLLLPISNPDVVAN